MVVVVVVVAVVAVAAATVAAAGGVVVVALFSCGRQKAIELQLDCPYWHLERYPCKITLLCSPS